MHHDGLLGHFLTAGDMSTMKLCFKVVCLFLLLARILLAQTRLLMVAWFAAGLTNHIDILIQIQLKLNFCSSPLRSIDMLLMRALTDNCVLLDLKPSSCSHKLKLFYGNLWLLHRWLIGIYPGSMRLASVVMLILCLGFLIPVS